MNKWAAYDMFDMRSSTPQEQNDYKNMLNRYSVSLGRSIWDMNSEIEIDYCDICHKKKQVQRKYYHYGIRCECCGSPHGHFEIVKYCADCKPVPPDRISAKMKPIEIKYERASR